MNYQLTDNETWALALMTLVYQPMIKNKTGSVHLNALLGRLPERERAPIYQGIQALVDMNFFVITEGAIHITNRSEGALQFLGMISNGSEEEVKDCLANSPTLSKFIKDVNDEIRLRPPVMSPTIDTASKSKVQVTTDPTKMSPWAKIGWTVFVVWILLGLFKLITTKL